MKSLFALTVLAILMMAGIASATDITTCEELQNMNLNLADSYQLLNDIDCTNSSMWDGGAGFLPVGNETDPFTGSLDGQSYNITNLYMNRDNYVGLFGYADSSAFNDVTLDNATINGTSYIGSLIGYLTGSSYIENVYSTVAFTITGDFVGGIAGYNEGDIYNSYSNGVITGTIPDNHSYIGGLAGFSNGIIYDSYSTATITVTVYNSGSMRYSGGLAGGNAGAIYNSWIKSPLIYGRWVVGNADTGGFVGTNSGTLVNCSAQVTLIRTSGSNGGSEFGGFAGYSNGTINNCSSTLTTMISITSKAGGFVGANYGNINGSYAYFGAAGVVATSQSGALVGYNNGSISYSFSTGSVGGLTAAESGGLVGTNNGLINFSYSTAVTKALSNSGGLVGNNIGTVINSYATGTFWLGSNGIGGGGLVGNNNGNISKSYSSGSVQSCPSSGSTCGGLVGANSGSINESYANGTMSGNGYKGGLVGRNSGTIFNSYASGATTGSGGTKGGLVALNFGTVVNSYATGAVTAGGTIGGLVANNTGTVTNSFWDNQTTGVTTSAAGTGKTTADMKDIRTFTQLSYSINLTSAWDFVGDPFDDAATADIWNMDSSEAINSGYPFFSTITATPLYILPPSPPITGGIVAGNPILATVIPLVIAFGVIIFIFGMSMKAATDSKKSMKEILIETVGVIIVTLVLVTMLAYYLTL